MIMNLTYTARAKQAAPAGKRLLELMDAKQTNLALSADVTTADALLTLADTLGPEIAILKTHIDIVRDFTTALSQKLRALADQHQFLLFEDRKFADIGHTVREQYAGGLYQIADWADLVNAHALPGPGLIEGLKQASRPTQGLILIAEMSSQGNLMSKDYIAQTSQMATHYPDFVVGFVTQRVVSPDAQWINFTPGIQLQTGKDGLGQQYNTPEEAILERGADVIIVGRDIIKSENPLKQAQIYRKQGFLAYQKRIQ
jgi:uridine monophosphate synthetase